MAKIIRKNMKIFGANAGFQERAEFGSLAAGSPSFTTDPETIQALSNYLDGWFGAVLGNNSPAIEDMNSLHFLYAYQLAYLLQEGIPEWSALTTYYIGSLAQDGNGVIYVSKTNTNLNNALSSTANWKIVGGNIITTLGDIIYGGTNGNQTRLPIGVDGSYLGVTAGIPTWKSPVGSMIWLYGTNGYGLGTPNSGGPGGPNIVRWATVNQSIGSDITYTDDVTYGGSFTINADGIYAVSATQDMTSGAFGITLNDVALSTNINNGTYAPYVLAGGNVGNGGFAATAKMSAGDIVRVRTNGAGSSGNAAFETFIITQVARL